MKPKMEFDTASLAVIGVDIGKEVFSPCWVRRRREDRLPQEDQAIGSQRRVREAAAVHRRHGSLPERALCQQSSPRLGTPATDHPGDLRQTVREGAEE